MTIEKRHLARTQKEFNAQLIYRGRTFSVKARNLSDGGIFLKTDTLQIPQGTLVDLEFHHSEYEWQISGLIVHQNSLGFGVMFTTRQPEFHSLNKPGFQKGSTQPGLIELPVQG